MALQQQQLAREVDEIPQRMGWDLTWHLASWNCAKVKTSGFDHERTTQETIQIPRSSVGKGV